MYPLHSVNETYQFLCKSIFVPGVNPRNHESWPELLELLEDTNEVRGLYVCTKPDGNRIKTVPSLYLINKVRDVKDKLLLSQGHTISIFEPVFVRPYWEVSDYKLLYQTKSLEGLLDIALKMLRKMSTSYSRPVEIVCGPISTGGILTNEGTADIQANKIRFYKTVKKLQKEGLNVFDQMVFHEAMEKIFVSSGLTSPEFNKKLLHEFYLQIFESGFIKKKNFIHDWKSSWGANFEHNQAEKLGIEIMYLPKDFVDNKKVPNRVKVEY